MMTKTSAKNFVPHIWTIETSDGEFDVIRSKCDDYGICRFQLNDDKYFVCDYTDIMLSGPIGGSFIGYIKPNAGIFCD